MAQLALPRIVACALFFDEDGRVLLVRPSYTPMWDLPGGHPAAGETPSQACGREVAEQLGLHRPVGPLLVADWAPHPAEGDKIQFLFDGGLISAAEEAGFCPDPVAVAEYVFCAPDDLEDLLAAKLARRAVAGVFARDHRRTLYLEHGVLSCTNAQPPADRLSMPPQPGRP